MPTKVVKTAKPRGRAFEKGNRANPNGRPVAELTLSSVIKRKLVDQYTGEEYQEAVANVEHIAHKIINTALTTKDPQVLKQFAEFIADRTEGKAVQKTELTGEDGGPLRVDLVSYSDLSTDTGENDG